MPKKKQDGTLRVKFIDGTDVDAFVLPADRVAFERKYDLAFDDVEVPREEFVLYLAFTSLRRQGYTEPGIVFEQWIQLVSWCGTP